MSITNNSDNINNCIVWKWSSGAGFIPYSIENQKIIETEYKRSRGYGGVLIYLDTSNGRLQYRIYFQDLVQECVTTGKTRKLVRIYDPEFWLPIARKMIRDLRSKLYSTKYARKWCDIWFFKPVTKVIDGEEIIGPASQFYYCRKALEQLSE
jgi:hypothetical protein